MQYLGGKAKIAKRLGAYLRSRLEGRFFVEPFCGALNITTQMEGPRLAADASPYLFSLYKALRSGWAPPDTLSDEEWRSLKKRKDPSDPMTAFAGYGCSFGGKFFAGYAKNDLRYNYAASAKSTLLKKFARCVDVSFACCSYADLTPGTGHLVYCDPPYADTTAYVAVGRFDSEAFWQWARKRTELGACVLVSEYKAPPGWHTVWETETKTSLHCANGQEKRIEKLFEFKGY